MNKEIDQNLINNILLDINSMETYKSILKKHFKDDINNVKKSKLDEIKNLWNFRY